MPFEHTLTEQTDWTSLNFPPFELFKYIVVVFVKYSCVVFCRLDSEILFMGLVTE